MSETYYIYGVHSTISALKNRNRKVLSVFCSKNIFNEHQNLIKNFEYKIVENSYISNLLNNDVTHQGICAKVHQISTSDIKTKDLSKVRTIVILDQITDSHNIGSVIRSAVFFGIEDIVIQKDCCPSENGGIAKASSGAIEYVNMYRVVNISNTIEHLKKNGFWVVGMDSDGDDRINRDIFNGKIAVVLGSENAGIRKLVRSKCDFLYKIGSKNKRDDGNQYFSIDSLNVSNAAAIMFHTITNPN